ncbi:hypothetical protein GGF50DRAFT_111458 [Schizophyllum commune]
MLNVHSATTPRLAAFSPLPSPRMPTPQTASFFPRSPMPGMRGQEEVLDRWMEGFQQHEQTLAAMAQATLDQSFKDELATIEQWFTVLSESERTATAYTLLQHSNLSQLHFFASVTQQMIRAIEGQCMSPAFPDRNRKQRTNDSLRPPRLQMPASSPSSPRSSPRVDSYNTPSTAVDNNPGLPLKSSKALDFPDLPDTPQELMIPGRAPDMGSWANLVPTPQFNMFPKAPEKPALPTSPFGVLNQFNLNTPNPAETQMLALQLMMNGLMKNGQAVDANVQPAVPAMSEPPKRAQRASVSSASSNTNNQNNWRAGGAQNGGGRYGNRGTRGSGRTSGARGGAGANGATPLTEEGFDPRMLTDIPGWLKSLRLHKYTACFAHMPWQEMVMLTEEQLEAKGVTALGARRRMMKMFEVARKKMGMEEGGSGSEGEVEPSMDVSSSKTPSPAAPTVALRA